MRVHCIKERQAIEAKDSTLQSGKDSQRALVPCLNVAMQLLKYVECVGLKQRDGCTRRTLEDDRPLASSHSCPALLLTKVLM